MTNEELGGLLKERAQARASKDYATADRIRSQLEARDAAEMQPR